MPDPESIAAVSTAVSETMKGMGGLFGPARDEIGQIFADFTRTFRAKNQLKLFQKTKKYFDESGVPIHAVNLKVLYPLIEHSSLEENETLQEMWSKLLAQSASGSMSQAFLSNCVDVLKSLSGPEVLALETMYEEFLEKRDLSDEPIELFEEHKVQFNFADLSTYLALDIQNDEIQAVLDNLIRLGLLRYAPPVVEFPDSDEPNLLARMSNPNHTVSRQTLTPDAFHLTAFGVRLLSTCGANALNKNRRS